MIAIADKAVALLTALTPADLENLPPAACRAQAPGRRLQAGRGACGAKGTGPAFRRSGRS